MHATYSAQLIVIVCIALIKFDENTLHQAPQHVIFFGLFLIVTFSQ